MNKVILGIKPNLSSIRYSKMKEVLYIIKDSLNYNNLESVGEFEDLDRDFISCFYEGNPNVDSVTERYEGGLFSFYVVHTNLSYEEIAVVKKLLRERLSSYYEYNEHPADNGIHISDSLEEFYREYYVIDNLKK